MARHRLSDTGTPEKQWRGALTLLTLGSRLSATDSKTGDKYNREKTMNNDTSHDSVRPIVRKMAEDTRAGKMSRREFVALASTFGASSAATYGLLGLVAPTPAQAQEGKKGGVLRVASRMGTLIDPATNKAIEGAIERVDDFTVRLNLPRPDITIIAGMSDYPALCVHRSFDEDGNLATAPIGTGPFELVSIEIGVAAEYKRRENGKWWGGDVYLDGIRFIDFGTDNAAIVAAFDGDEVDINDESTADFIESYDALGLIKQSKPTANTIVARMRADTPPYDSKELRNAIQLACDNAVLLQISINGEGIPAENHHVAPFHPEYAQLPAIAADPAKAIEMAKAAGHGETEIEIISIDGDWRTTTTDAIGAQLRDAGFTVKRTVIPGSTFWNDWTKYPFSTTNWGPRPLGVQVLALAYKSGEAWNESGHANPEFDALLDEALGIFDADKRREYAAKLQTMLQDSGAIIQPFWRNQALHHTDKVKDVSAHQFREMHFEKVWLDA